MDETIMGKLVLAALDARITALEEKLVGHGRQRLTKRALAEREGVSEREVDRRRASGIYAQPEIERKRCYWWSDTYRLVPATTDTAAARAARKPQSQVIRR